MNAESKLSRLILSSPWFLLIFLAVPLLVILSVTLHMNTPLVNTRALLYNNLCFAGLAFCRLLWYLARLPRALRYGEGLSRPAAGFELSQPVDQARASLSAGGFLFNAAGRYGEKRDTGYLGSTILYAGLFLVLATGSLDNLRQFAGTVMGGVGPATKLSDPKSYRHLVRGPLAARTDSLPQMRILSQILPDSTYPQGATQVAFLPEHGDPVIRLLTPGTIFPYGAYDIYMTRLVFEPELVIKEKTGRQLFDAFVPLEPLVQKRGDFSFYGLFFGGEVVGGAYYQPEKSLMMVVITRNGKRVVGDMQFQVDQQVTVGDYVLSCAKMGQWSEIHVVHRRHKVLLFLGGGIALFGLILRLCYRAQRVWLEESLSGGTRVSAAGIEARRLLQQEAR